MLNYQSVLFTENVISVLKSSFLLAVDIVFIFLAFVTAFAFVFAFIELIKQWWRGDL